MLWIGEESDALSDCSSVLCCLILKGIKKKIALLMVASEEDEDDSELDEDGKWVSSQWCSKNLLFAFFKFQSASWLISSSIY